MERAKSILISAVRLMDLTAASDIVFSNYDEIQETFEEDWTPRELFIIIGLMYQIYLDKDIAKIKLVNVNYTPSELRVLDPSNARSSFMEMYKFICEQNKQYLDEYRNQDRLTGKYISVDYSDSDE